jgi:murein L,D-transpeptidase YcbB/YkuD
MDSIAVAADSMVLDATLAAALGRFQARHGLTADRKLGHGSLRALRVPMATRVAQIELAMERIRWYPRNHGNRVVRVNIPAYTMTASAPTGEGELSQLDSRVIVGKPGRRHTPLFAGPITRIEFSPMWYVPQSIAKRAILPTIRRNPNYVRARDFEFRLPNGRTTQRVTNSILKRVASNAVRLQQRSGPHNALGRVKFILPNSRAIFLHDTNKRQLFDRNARALSFGCVRVEQPLALAELLLADQPQWNRAAIDKAVADRKTVRAHTSEETTVMLQYMTAEVGANGALRFLPDIYAMDKAALKPVKRWRNGVQPTETDWRLLATLQGLAQAS